MGYPNPVKHLDDLMTLARFVDNGEALAARLLACKDACEGIPTESLRPGMAQEMREALEWLLHLFHGVGIGGKRPTDDEWEDALQRAEDALRKARGEEAPS